MDELKRLVQYRKEVLGSKFKPVTGLCLSSRRNLCIHPKINKQDIRTQVDISMNPMSSFPRRHDECHRYRMRSERKMYSRGAVREPVPSGDIEDLGCSFYESYVSSSEKLSLPAGMYARSVR